MRGSSQKAARCNNFIWTAETADTSRKAPPLTSRNWRNGRRKKAAASPRRSEEHTSELQSLMRISYAVFCLKKKKKKTTIKQETTKRNTTKECTNKIVHE